MQHTSTFTLVALDPLNNPRHTGLGQVFLPSTPQGEAASERLTDLLKGTQLEIESRPNKMYNCNSKAYRPLGGKRRVFYNMAKFKNPLGKSTRKCSEHGFESSWNKMESGDHMDRLRSPEG